MLQHFKKPMAVVCAFIMCLSMLTGIVLPYMAETATAATENPYAEAEKHATKLTVGSNGTVTPKAGVTLAVPSEYRGQDIYLPNAGEKLRFYNPNWRTPENAGVNAVGDYLFIQYGDGTTWGNGKVYLVQWGISMFGGEWSSDPMSFPVMQEKMMGITPVEGGDNNYYVLCFPGYYRAATTTKAHALPSADPAASDLLNAHYLGPQAGKTPVSSDPESGTIANGRGLDDTKEMILTNWIYSPKNAVFYWDGIAMSEGCHLYNRDWNAASGTKVSGLYLDNVYVDQTNAENLFDLGWYETWGFVANDPTSSGAGHNYIMSAVHMTDSYFKISGGGGTTFNTGNPHENHLEANDLVIDGCVFENFGTNATTKTDNGEFGLSAGEKSRSNLKFLGERAGWNVDITNNTFIDMQSNEMISVYGTDLLAYGDTANINFSGNRVLNYGNTTATNYLFNLEFMDRNGDGAGAVAENHQANISFCDNYITINKQTAATNHNFAVIYSQSMDAGSKGLTIHGNTIVGTKLTTNGNKWHYDFASSNATNDISGNLFLDYEGRVRSPRISTIKNDYTEYTVLSDVYASDEMAGGVKELFTITESPEDLFVAHSMIQTVVEGNDTADLGYIRGTITVYPENGVTYDTENLFAFGNEEVDLIGVYNTEADAINEKNKVFALTKGFGTAYVKAEYKAGNTTATVIYTMVEPSKFHVVVPDGSTTYDFNGDTYTAGDTAAFYTTLADAVAGANADWETHADLGAGIYAPPCAMKPLKNVIIVAPGTYADDITLTRATAIIGPGFGKKASTQGALTVANGRGADADTEAVITGITTLSMHEKANDLYVAVSGVSFYGQAYAFAYDYSGNVQADHKTRQRFAYLNLCDVYAAPTIAFVRHGGYNANGGEEWNNDSHINGTLFYVNLDNSYITKTAGGYGDPIFYGSITGLNITDSTLNITDNPYATIYKMALSGTNFVTKPLRDYMKIDNCYVKTGSTYAFTNAVRNSGIEDVYAKGSLTSFTNNIFETDNIVYRAMPNGADAQHLVFTDNTVKRSANNGTAVIDVYLRPAEGAKDTDAKFVSADISGNKIINASSPWDLNEVNSVNVDENFYGTADGKAQKISGGSGYVKSDWYYINDEMEIKDTQFGLDLSAVSYKSETTLVPDFTVDTALPCGVDTISVDDIKAIDGCEIVGIYKDADGTEPLTDSITEDTFYVKTKVEDVEVVFTVNAGKSAQHSYGEFEFVVQPTCTESGLQERVCANCGATEQSVVNPLNHPQTVREDRPATCTENAGIFYVCVLCEEVFDSEIVENSALGHDWGEYTEKVVGNCVTDTVLERCCEREGCSVTETQTITALGHEWSEWENSIAPTCTEDGEQIRTCGVCLEEETQVATATGHTTEVVITEPTCVDEGKEETVCSACGYVDETLTVILPATGVHTWGNPIVKEPTCAAEGVSERFCTVCDGVDKATRVITPADTTKHSFDAEGKDWVVTVKGDCLTNHVEERKCPECGETEIRIAPAIGEHSYKEVTTPATYDQTGKVEKVCSECDDTVLVKLLPRLVEYKDLDTKAWYAGYVVKAVEAGLFKGYEDGTIRPEANITRAEAVTLFARIAGVNTSKYSTTKFSDVAKGAWYNGAIAWAEQNKIVSGRTQSTFDPNGNINRQELCTILVRYTKHAGIKLNAKLAKTDFADDANIAKYAKENVYLCQRAGIISGRPGNRFAPTDYATRAEVAKILISFMEEYVD